MKAELIQKLTALTKRHQEVGKLLSTPTILQDQNQFKNLSKEYAELSPIARCFEEYQTLEQTLITTEELLKDPDEAIAKLAEEEKTTAKIREKALEHELQLLLLPKDPDDAKNIYLEIRAGTGGNEAAIFAGDLYRMYARHAERSGWKIEVVSEARSEAGGYKEIILRVIGKNVYSQLKFESGGHRVQRVPVTEAQGRIHTSTCTIAVLPEAEEIDDITINPTELKVDTFRASGAGGQHVNVTDSAVRITHLPTGLVVECQDERSQHKNRSRALSLLQARLLDAKRKEQKAKRASERRILIGSGERSERIRTYNFPQNRITDHRIGLTLYQLQDILEGHLEPLITPIIQEAQAEELSSIGKG
ncbi:MAG: peptide chain release factor 1 [Gammaproteobacteria bacterium]|nr:peptide chain release factor 1 [Gammaproteobacteria bacterium]